MSNDANRDSLRRARRVSAFLPPFFSNAFVSVTAILAVGLIFFLALMGLLNLSSSKPSASVLSQIEVTVFFIVVVLSVIGIVLLFINWMLAITGNSAEQFERVQKVSARNKLRKKVVRSMEKAAEMQSSQLSSSTIEALLPQPEED